MSHLLLATMVQGWGSVTQGLAARHLTYTWTESHEWDQGLYQLVVVSTGLKRSGVTGSEACP